MPSAIQLRTADLLLVSGRGAVSRAIKARTCNKWHALKGLLGWPCWQCVSHVAIVAQAMGQLLVFESTTLSSLPCAVSGQRRSGMQAHGPADWLAGAGGAVWQASLAPWYGLDDRDQRKLSEFLLDAIDRGYDPRGALVAGIGRPRDSDLSTVFCSEIVAAGLMVAGVMPRDNASRYHPSGLIRDLVRRGIYGLPRRLK